MKMGLRDLCHSKDRNRKIEVLYARADFFTGIEIDVPDTLEFLKDKALPIYIQLLTTTDISAANKNIYRYLNWDYIKHANKDYCYQLIPLKNILDEWSDKYNLFDEWIKEMALNTLAAWSSTPPTNGKLYWEGSQSIMYASPFPRNCSRLHFNHPGWDPVKKTWKQAKRIIMNDFKHFLEHTYHKKVSNLVEKADLKPPIVKRQMERHIRWLIDYQVHNNKSYNDICQEEIDKRSDGKAVDITTIIKGITSMAKLIGLTLKNK